VVFVLFKKILLFFEIFFIFNSSLVCMLNALLINELKKTK